MILQGLQDRVCTVCVRSVQAARCLMDADGLAACMAAVGADRHLDRERGLRTFKNILETAGAWPPCTVLLAAELAA